MAKIKYGLLLAIDEKKNFDLVVLIKDVAQELEMKLDICTDTTKALATIKSGSINTVIVDLESLEDSGVGLLHSIRSASIETPILIAGSEHVHHLNLSASYRLTNCHDKEHLKEKISKSVRFDLSLRETYHELRSWIPINDSPSSEDYKSRMQSLKIKIFSEKMNQLIMQDRKRHEQACFNSR